MAQLFTKLKTADETLRMVQDNVSKVVDPLVRRPWVGDAVLLESVQLTWNVANYIPHKLVRPIQGWEVVRRIARPGGADERLRLFDGAGDPAFAANWGNFGSSYQVGGYQVGPEGRAHLQGFVRTTTSTYFTAIATLPDGARPIEKEIFPTSPRVDAAPRAGFIEVTTAGVIACTAASGAAPAVSLDVVLSGVSFYVSNPYHAGAHLWDLNSDTTVDERLRSEFLILRPTANCTVSLVVW